MQLKMHAIIRRLQQLLKQHSIVLKRRRGIKLLLKLTRVPNGLAIIRLRDSIHRLLHVPFK